VTGWCLGDQLPDWPAESPYGSRAWMLAWRQVRTEPVHEARFLRVGPVTAPFYLVTDSPAWSAFEAEAGLDQVWPGRVIFCPSPYATYGLQVTSPEQIRAIVAHGLAWAREAGAVAAVFPGLRDPGAWMDAAGGIAVRTTGSHEAPVRGSVDAFQGAIHSQKGRREFGRQWRRGTDAGLRLAVRYGAEMLPVLPVFTELAGAAAGRHGVALYDVDVFRAVAQVPGAVLLAAEHGRDLAGAFLALRHDHTLYLWAAGLDYNSMHDLHTYSWLFAESVKYAAAKGLVMIDAGRGNYLVKRRMGFTQVPLHALCYLANPDPALAAALTEMSRRIAVASAAGETGHAVAAIGGIP
jgi:hypothetical protein